MSAESVARLFVGIAFLWIVIVLLVGVIGGFDKPTVWLKFIGEQFGQDRVTQIRWVMLALTFFVVPLGILTYLRDLFGDPVGLWVKCAAPGAFAAVYGLVLVAVVPDVGRPFLLWVEGIVRPIVGLTGLKDTLEDTGSWLIRSLAALALLAGVPGVVGAILGLASGQKPARRR